MSIRDSTNEPTTMGVASPRVHSNENVLMECYDSDPSEGSDDLTLSEDERSILLPQSVTKI